MRNVLPLLALLCGAALAAPGTVTADVLGSPSCGVLTVTLGNKPERIEVLGVKPLDDDAGTDRCRTLTAQLAGKKVLLLFPEGLRQYSDRKRANVFNAGNQLVAAELLKLGYAQAVSVTGNPYSNALAILSQAAHARRIGAWR